MPQRSPMAGQACCRARIRCCCRMPKARSRKPNRFRPVSTIRAWGPNIRCCLWAGRVRYEAATDDESLEALTECCRTEGILPAIESAHAFAGAKRWARVNPGKKVLIGLSGRGDKDMPTLQRTVLAEQKK